MYCGYSLSVYRFGGAKSKDKFSFIQDGSWVDPLSPQVRENGQARKGHIQGQTIFQESWRAPQFLGVVRFP